MEELHLYEIAITDIHGRRIEFAVASWNGPFKAVAMAVQANDHRSRPIRVHEVAVEDRGVVAQERIPAKALVDRMEF